ncbi:MobA/MobL family protein, partial [Bacillus cereus]|nr:MobA/MobL family protein [Bacillus cereus]
MAIYHLKVKTISRKKQQNVVASAAYRSGESLYCERTKETKYYSRTVQPETHILAPSEAPSWVFRRQDLWNEVERFEKRGNSRLAREVVVAIPNELSEEQQRELVLTFTHDTFVQQRMIADVAIHRDDKNNPHAHILLTTREISQDGFVKKKNR